MVLRNRMGYKPLAGMSNAEASDWVLRVLEDFDTRSLPYTQGEYAKMWKGDGDKLYGIFQSEFPWKFLTANFFHELDVALHLCNVFLDLRRQFDHADLV